MTQALAKNASGGSSNSSSIGSSNSSSTSASVRARSVDLNGHSERMELLLLTFVAPLWGLVMPLIGLTADLSFIGFLMIGASVFCLLHFLHLQFNNFSFEKDGLRLPGVDHRLRPYKSITRLYIECADPFVLAVQYQDAEKPDDPAAAKTKTNEPQIFEAHSLTEENARQLWQLTALYLRTADISIDIRDRLLDWRRGAADQANEAAVVESGGSLDLAKDLTMSLELRPFNPLKLVAKYMESYSDTFRKTWLTFWGIVAVFAYPICLVQHYLPKQATTAATALAAEPTQTMLGNNLNSIKDLSIQTIATMFGNHWGAAGLILILCFITYRWIKIISSPDLLAVDFVGITTQKKIGSGVQPREHRGWHQLERIFLVRPSEKSNSSRWSVVFAQTGKSDVTVPFKAFASERTREKFSECLSTFGHSVSVQPELLEALSPAAETSYTELWMSAMTEAPKLEDLTPHSQGHKLQEGQYEIIEQFASGGQGVAYLAKYADSASGIEGRVVLKESVLPIYVDDKARTRAIDRFKRDARLLASLDHNLIVGLRAFFVENNRAYLALEYVAGKTLQQKIEADGPLEETEVRRLALLMTEVLIYLHGRTPPVVHRDFTPDNIILTEEGKIKLIDFDVAVEHNVFAQANATIVGKQAYIPLEQFRGKATPQSDIYALGATLSYMLTGLEPAAMQASHPSTINEQISFELDQIVAAATAVEVAERTADAQSLHDLLKVGVTS